jgi:hypothetical protein
VNPRGRGDGRTEVQERVQVDLIVEDTESAADHEIAFRGRLIGESEAWSEMVLTRIKERMAAILDHKSRSGNEVGDIARVIGLHWPEVFVTEAVLEVELFRELPGILQVRIDSVDVNKALRISDHDR